MVTKAHRRKLDRARQKRYTRTPKGFLVRLYRNMKSRVEGINAERAHLYMGLPIIDKEEFYTWALNHPEFIKLFDTWVKKRYNRKYTPSVDRVDPTLGYTFDNMEWVTASENSRRATLRRSK